MAELTKDAQRQQALFEQIDSLDQEIAMHNEVITSLSLNLNANQTPLLER
jgi:predicted component of type VI protein secretion system